MTEYVERRGPSLEGSDSSRELSRRSAMDYRLIARSTEAQTSVLILELSSGERILPVFSAEAEVQMFVWQGGLDSLLDGAWYPRCTKSGELLAMLIGPRRSVDRVGLDPSPQIMTAGGDDEIELVCVSRKEFVERLLSDRCKATIS